MVRFMLGTQMVHWSLSMRFQKTILILSKISFLWFFAMFLFTVAIYSTLEEFDPQVHEPSYSGCYSTNHLLPSIVCKGFTGDWVAEIILNVPGVFVVIIPFLAESGLTFPVVSAYNFIIEILASISILLAILYPILLLIHYLYKQKSNTT